MAAALRSKPSRDTASSAVSQFRYFVFNYMHVAQVASSHYAHRTKSDDLFMNTPYHFTSFKPVLLGGNFVEKGSQIFDHPRASQSVSKNSDKNWGRKLSNSRCTTVVSSQEDPLEVWSGDGIVVQPKVEGCGRAGVSIYNVDLPTATEFGCLVVNAPTANTVAAAEHGIAHVKWPGCWVCRFRAGFLPSLGWGPACFWCWVPGNPLPMDLLSYPS